MKRLIAVILLMLGWGGCAFADEAFDLATPRPVREEAVAHLEIAALHLVYRPAPAVVVILQAVKADGSCATDSNGTCKQQVERYDGEAALAMLNALETANLSTNSLHKRVLQKLRNDNRLPAGAVSGVPGLTPLSTETPTETPTAVDTPTPRDTATPRDTPTP